MSLQRPTAGTYKLKKRDLQAEGCDPGKVEDSLLLLDTKTRYDVG